MNQWTVTESTTAYAIATCDWMKRMKRMNDWTNKQTTKWMNQWIVMESMVTIILVTEPKKLINWTNNWINKLINEK